MEKLLKLLNKIKETAQYETIKRYFANVEIEDVQIIPAHRVRQEYDTLEDLYLDLSHFTERVSKVSELKTADIVVLTLVNDDVKLFKAEDIARELDSAVHWSVKQSFLKHLQIDKVVTEAIDPRSWYE